LPRQVYLLLNTPAFTGHTTVHEPLDSHGSRCSAVAITELPMSEERWSARTPIPMAKPLELAASPADQKGIDPRQGGTQLCVIEVTVVVDPTADARIVHRCQVLRGFVAAAMKRQIDRACSHRSRRGMSAPDVAAGNDERLPGRCDPLPSGYPTVACLRSLSEFPLAAPAEESSFLRTSDSRACRGCSKDRPQTRQPIVRLLRPLPGSPSHA
jgi:hypothetical protein